jgi:hypothetical protein
MFHYLRATYTRYLHSHFCYDMPGASSAAAAAAIAINSTWLIPQFRKKRKTRFINTCAYVLGHRLSKSRLKLADIDFAVAVGVHELQGKGMSVGANNTSA